MSHFEQQEQEVSLLERQDPLFSAMNHVAAKLEELKHNDVNRKYTSYCKFCGNASVVERPPPKKILTSSELSTPIAPTLSEENRTFHEQSLNDCFKELHQAEEALEKAKKDLEEARERAEIALSEAKSANRMKWEQEMTQRFSVGQVIALTSGELVRIESVRSDKPMLTVSPAKYFRDSSALDNSKRTISIRAIQSNISEATAEAIEKASEDYDKARAEHSALTSQPCPSVCSKCGHAHCYTYHYADRSDLGGWEVVCCSPTCSCFNCQEARKKYRHYEYKCCNCSINPYCECSLHRGW